MMAVVADLASVCVCVCKEGVVRVSVCVGKVYCTAVVKSY